MRQVVRELCDGCMDLANCETRELLPRPILECEAFRKADATIDRKEGLCSTCELRESCERRLVEGGVWRCAEYR